MIQSNSNVDNGAAINMAAALDRVDGDREFLSELAAIFLEEAPRIMEQIADAVSRGDAKALELAAHSLKGSAANLAACDVADVSKRLEFMARDGEMEHSAATLESLDACMEQLRLELEALL